MRCGLAALAPTMWALQAFAPTVDCKIASVISGIFTATNDFSVKKCEFWVYFNVKKCGF